MSNLSPATSVTAAIHSKVSSLRSQVLGSYATSGEEIRRVEETICFEENNSGHQRNR
jgi:hypothetical protein